MRRWPDLIALCVAAQHEPLHGAGDALATLVLEQMDSLRRQRARLASAEKKSEFISIARREQLARSVAYLKGEVIPKTVNKILKEARQAEGQPS